ncbi:MAG: GntR family transcriptional regulator [Deltaproteobacteria bacterium]|nr:GntR family transcriptional regulator [Deltaproteobacteria bacterium]
MSKKNISQPVGGGIPAGKSHPESGHVLTFNRPRLGSGPEPIHPPTPDAEDSHHFLINKTSAVPLHIQLKEQVRYAIMSGYYAPGSPLPSIRELTTQLGIHRNTVHRVYLELQAGGLLVSRPGKGVFVNETLSEVVSSREVNAIDHLLDTFFASANQAGINPITLGRLIAQRAPAYDSRQSSVAFVECTTHQSSECSRDLSESFGIQVTQTLLDDLRKSPGNLAPNLFHVITSLFHYDEIRDLLKGTNHKIHAITYDLHPATRKLLREQPPGTRLGFICHDANTEEIVGAEIEKYVSPGVLAGCANLESPQTALDLIQNTNKIILTEAASAFCVQHCTPAHELLELHFVLNPTSVEKVGKSILIQP